MSKRDWSSDVCSSDLGDLRGRVNRFARIGEPARLEPCHAGNRRSEERRVGKERRSSSFWANARTLCATFAAGVGGLGRVEVGWLLGRIMRWVLVKMTV